MFVLQKSEVKVKSTHFTDLIRKKLKLECARNNIEIIGKLQLSEFTLHRKDERLKNKTKHLYSQKHRFLNFSPIVWVFSFCNIIFK